MKTAPFPKGFWKFLALGLILVFLLLLATRFLVFPAEIIGNINFLK